MRIQGSELMNESFLTDIQGLTLQERKVLLRNLKSRLKILSPTPINRKQIARQLERARLIKETQLLQQRLYYIQNKEKLNQNRKLYHRSLMPRMTKKYLEFRKKEIEARFNDPEFVYHNTMDRERERKDNGYYEDTRKRIDE